MKELGVEELKVVSNHAWSLIKGRRNMDGLLIKSKLRVGSRVSISSRRNGNWTGTIEKINRTRAIVIKDTTKVGWNVPFNMITLMEIGK